jgi:5-methylcytosine-specific restriction endonuclease McrA
VRKILRKQTESEWRLIYNAFLLSPEWATKRAAILRRAHNTCESCLNKPASQIHHVVYPQPLTLSSLQKQPAWQLRAVCSSCHEHVHDRD